MAEEKTKYYCILCSAEIEKEHYEWRAICLNCDNSSKGSCIEEE